MNDNIDELHYEADVMEMPDFEGAFSNIDGLDYEEDVVLMPDFEEAFDWICTVFNRIRISHFLPKSRERLWIECADKITKAGHAVMDFADAMGVYSLVREDTHVLLRKGAFEVIAICISRYIDPSTNCLLFGKTSLPERAFYTTDMEERDLVSSIFNFAKDIADLKLTPDELGVYSALILYNEESPGLRFPNEVEKKKNYMLFNLKFLLDLDERQPLENGVTVYDALIAKIPELRLIGFMYRNAVAKFKHSHPHIELPRLHQALFEFDALRATAA